MVDAIEKEILKMDCTTADLRKIRKSDKIR
jgi:hypothetical protein